MNSSWVGEEDTWKDRLLIFLLFQVKSGGLAAGAKDIFISKARILEMQAFC